MDMEGIPLNTESEQIRAQKIADAKLQKAREFLGEKWLLHKDCPAHQPGAKSYFDNEALKESRA